MVQHEGEEYLTIEEAAVFLGKSRRTVERYVTDKRLSRYWRGLRVMFKRSDLESFKRSLEEEPEIRPDKPTEE